MAISLANFKIFLKRDPMRSTPLVVDDVDGQNALNASAEAIAGWTGRSDFDTYTKVLASSSHLMAEIVFFYASYLMSLQTPQAESSINFGDSLVNKKNPMTDFSREAVINHVQQQLALGGFRDITKWIDTEAG